MSLQDKLERVLRDLHIMIARGETIPGRENKVIIDKKQAALLLNHLNECVYQMMEEYQVTADSKEQALREKKVEAGKIIKEAETQSEDIYAASVIYTDEAIERLLEIFDKASESAKHVMEDMSRQIQEEKSEIAKNQLELKSGLEELKDTAKYVRIIEAKNKERARAKTEKELKRKGYFLGTRRESELSVVERELLMEQQEDKAKTQGENKDLSDTPKNESAKGVDVKETADSNNDDEIVYEKPTIHINEEYFKKAGISYEKEAETKEEKKADVPDDLSRMIEGSGITENDEKLKLDPETEKKLREDLDNEYFEWQDDATEDEAPKKKGLRAFLEKWEKP